MSPALLDDAPLTRNLCLAIVGLTALFVAIGADPADRLPLLLGLLYWLSHISLALGAAVLATRVLSGWDRVRVWPTWLVVWLGGSLGALLFTPVAMGVESLLPGVEADLDQDWRDRLEAQGGWFAVLGEFMQIYPSYIATWFLVQSTPLLGAYRPRHRVDISPDPVPLPSQAVGDSLPAPMPEVAQEPRAEADGEAGAELATAPEKASLLELLPPKLGEAIVIRADLHYLHVTATQGQASLLGTMAAVDRDLADVGLRVHRSFWVATAHVRRMVKGPYGWYCELSDGSKVPVSRRRVSAVRQRLNLP